MTKKICEWCKINQHNVCLHADFKVCPAYLTSKMQSFIVIHDLNLGSKSVTNDIEYVLWWIKSTAKNPTLFKKAYIIYKDSEGIFDEVLTDEQGQFKAFRSLQKSTDLEAAMIRCVMQHGQDAMGDFWHIVG